MCVCVCVCVCVVCSWVVVVVGVRVCGLWWGVDVSVYVSALVCALGLTHACAD